MTTIIGVLIMMISISPLMTVIALLILPVSMVLISVIVKHSQKYFKSQQEYLGHINGQVEEVYGGHNIVKAFNKEEDVIREFDETNDILFRSAWKSQFLSGMMMPIMQFVGNLRWLPCNQTDHRSWRYPVLYPVCKILYTADPAGCTGSKHAPVDSRCIRESI